MRRTPQETITRLEVSGILRTVMAARYDFSGRNCPKLPQIPGSAGAIVEFTAADAERPHPDMPRSPRAYCRPACLLSFDGRNLESPYHDFGHASGVTGCSSLM